MKFYNPVIQLGKETGELADKYFLHVVTFCSRSNFQADGFSIDDEELPNGLLKVTIKLRQVPQLPNFEFITPIIHTIDLGEVAFPFEDSTISVTVVGTVFQEPVTHSRAATAPPTTTKTGGTGTVSTTQADDKIRPTENPTLFGFCR